MRNKFIIDAVEAFYCHEGAIKWHLSSFPEVLITAYCQSRYSDGSILDNGNVVVFGDNNSIDIFSIKHLEIIDEGEYDQLFLPDYNLFPNYKLDQVVGITGVLNYNNDTNEWCLKTELFPIPLIIEESEYEIDKSFCGKKCKILANFNLQINEVV